MHGVIATDGKIGRGAGGRREHALGDCFLQGVEYGFGDALADLRGAARYRPGILRIKEGAVGILDAQRFEQARIDGQPGENMLDRQVDG